MSTALITPLWLKTCFQPAAKSQPVWLRTLQQEHQHAFTQRGVPTRREEMWKYTDVTGLEKNTYTVASTEISTTLATRVKQLRLADSIFLVFINGHYRAQLSDISQLPPEASICHLQQALAQQTEHVKKHLSANDNIMRFPFASLNMALLADGLFISIPKNTCIDQPIHVLYLSTKQNNFVACPRNIIIAGENSQVTVIEEYHSSEVLHYFNNIVTEVYAEANAHIDYYKIQNESLKATHIAQIKVNQKRNSRVKYVTLAIGSQLAREDVQVNLAESGSESSINGFYALQQQDQHVDNHVQIDHIATHTSSDMVYKGVLDKNAHGVFNGMIYVHPGAQKTQAHQANHNLLLSNAAAIDTKPEFEIYADDVKCVHGDTVGQLDTESLFYLRSRGISREEALRILARAFSAEVLDRVTHPLVSARMHAILEENGL